MKKVLALVLTIFMMVTLTAAALAVDAADIEETYRAYQIFSGTQAEDDPDGKLADIQWGSGIKGNEQALLTALKDSDKIGTDFVGCESAEDVARVVSGYKDYTEEANEFAKLCCQKKVGEGTLLKGNYKLDAGYYLIADVTDYGDADNVVRNLSLLQVTGKDEFKIEKKVTVPTVEKYVMEGYGDTKSGEDNWQKAADYDIGDTVPFKLTATVGKIKGFECYKLIFHDELSDGLVFINNKKPQITVTLTEAATNKTYTLKNNSDYSYTVKGQFLDVTINDLVLFGAVENDVIEVTYEAILTEDAAIGIDGNPNDVYLSYSNNPYDECGTTNGKTPKSEVKVYTWGVHADKVKDEKDASGNYLPLDGAEFQLFKKGDDNAIDTVMVEAVKKGDKIVSYTAKFDGLDSGEYVLKESKVPSGYNGIEPIEFKIVAIFNEGEETVKEFKVIEEDGEHLIADEETGIVTAQIVNKSGVVLPETGGEGTKLLTAVGAIALISGMVFVITKKRVGVEG